MLKRRDLLRQALFVAGAAAFGPLASPAPRAAQRFTRDPFSLGVASGYPASDGVVLWTRLAPEPLAPGGGLLPTAVPVTWELSHDEQFRRIARSGIAYAEPEWGHSVHVELGNLEPAREYWYRFTAGDARSPMGRTRTAPAREAAMDRMKLALVSCHQYEHGYFTAYRHMLDDNLDLIVHVGDYIYELSWGTEHVRSHNSPEAYTLDDYRARYSLYKSDPDLAAAHAAYPWLVTWDDHEVDNDYADGISEENDDPELFLARRAAAYRAYYEHMPLPRRAAPFGSYMRLYTQRAFGNLVSLSMLDQRQYRSREACPLPGRAGSNRVRVGECAELEAANRTMLGERQEAWLLALLAASRARWNLMAQGTLMAHIDEDAGPGRRYWTDSWNGYPAARARLMNFLAERKIANPVVLSGDIHAFIVSGLHRQAADLESPVVASELVGTSLSSQGIPQKMLDVWRSANPNLLFATGEHRGYLRLDATRERLQADLIAMETVKTPRAGRRTLRSFVVEDGRPGPVSL